MKNRAWILSAVLAVVCGGISGAWGATGEQIREAIDKGVKHLYAVESAGTWDDVATHAGGQVKIEDQNTLTGGQYGGLTAIATYALLSAGEDPKDRRMASAIDFLEKADIQGVYALGIRCLVWHALPGGAGGSADPAVRAAMGRDLALLERALHLRTYMYNYLISYPNNGQRGLDNYDHSVSQFGVLGMWALQESGLEVSQRYWEGIDAAWRREQFTDGSWDYHRNTFLPHHLIKQADSSPTAAMTEAGIASLFLRQDEMLMGSPPGPCHGNIKDTAIERGLDWMAEHFDKVFGDLDRVDAPFYALYGLERIGVASGRVYFKDINWFWRGADYLVKSQKPDGGWGKGVADTALALLFLVRGRAPVTINKLEYFDDVNGSPQEGDWNERPRDVANFNPWLAGQVEFSNVLNWQVLTLDAAPADLHAAPVLMISGDKALKFSDADEKKLKKYIDQGGLVLFNADCGSPAFTDSVIHLGTRLYPLSEFRPLTKDDAIFSRGQFHFGDPLPKVMGLSNGIRELMVLVPQMDLGRAWESRQMRMHGREFELGSNILMYACDKTGITRKGETYLVEPDANVTATRSIKVARIQYNGNWDPEPEAWPRMAAIMHNTEQMDLQIDAVKAGEGQLAGYKVAVLTGTGEPHLGTAEWIEISQFVQNGGTLIVDAAGGSAVFAAAMQNQLGAAFPGQAGSTGSPQAGLETPLDFSDPFYASGTAMTEIHFRPFTHTVLEDLSKPQIRGIKIGGRIGVFFSEEDLTEGLVGQHVDGVVGYEPESAVELVRRMVVK